MSINGPNILKGNSLDPQLTYQTIRELYGEIARLKQHVATMPKAAPAPLHGSGPVTSVAQIRKLLLAGNDHSLSIQSLLGRAAQPQIPYAPIVTALPPTDDPQSQDGALVVLLTAGTYIIYQFDGRTDPGAWTAVSYAPTTTVRPAVRAYNNAAISLTNNVLTTITYNSERYDTDTMHSTSANTNRLTVTTAGKYIVTLNLSFAANATGYRGGFINLNGTTPIAGMTTLSVGAGDRTLVSVATEYVLAAGDYVDSQAIQTSGGALNLESQNNYSPEFSAELTST